MTAVTRACSPQSMAERGLCGRCGDSLVCSAAQRRTSYYDVAQRASDVSDHIPAGASIGRVELVGVV